MRAAAFLGIWAIITLFSVSAAAIMGYTTLSSLMLGYCASMALGLGAAVCAFVAAIIEHAMGDDE